MSEINLKSIFNFLCDYCNGYDDTMNKCKYFACSIIEKEKAEKIMERTKNKKIKIKGDKKLGKINIYQGIYDMINNKPFNRNGYFHKETKQEMYQLPNKFKRLLNNKRTKFFFLYNSYKNISIRVFHFTLGTDWENNILAISICHPFFDMFDEELSETIVIGRIKRMRGDLKYETNKPIRDIHGKIILDENGKPIMKHRKRFYKPYDLDAKILDKDGNETDKLKYPYIKNI